MQDQELLDKIQRDHLATRLDLTSEIDAQAENLRTHALSQLVQVLESIPEYSDKDLERMDALSKQKRPLDKAKENLGLILDIWGQVDLTKEYLRKTGGKVTLQRQPINFPQRVSRGIKRPYYYTLYVDEFHEDGLYVGTEWTINPDKLEDWAISDDETKQKMVRNLGDLSVEDIGKSLLDALNYAAKRDNPNLEASHEKPKRDSQ